MQPADRALEAGGHRPTAQGALGRESVLGLAVRDACSARFAG